MSNTNEMLENFISGLKKRNPAEPEFHQAVYEVAGTVIPFIADKPIYQEMQVLERMAEPDRVVSFRVCWQDDKGNVRVNRGHRVQFNNSIGPYKGGCRFHPSVNLSVLKFLGFEQTFKNSLTGLPMGGGKGGANFNPKGKSDAEVMRFCQSFMVELARHIGPDTDVPAGDIGVGSREIGYMFGAYKRIKNKFEGVLTGKGLSYGGSKIRTQATGYGVVHFLENMMRQHKQQLEGRKVTISGSGNVATYAAEKVTSLGAKVISMSDSSGFIHDPDGMDAEKLAYIIDLKQVKRGRISEYTKQYSSASFHEGARPWSLACDIALPCATQNEINEAEANLLVKNGCIAVSEGANMPSEISAINVFQKAGVLFGPSKAANAGGVAVSGMEMSQNSGRISWSETELEKLLANTMQDIHQQSFQYGEGKGTNGVCDYVAGANIAGFVKVADAMLAFGVV